MYSKKGCLQGLVWGIKASGHGQAPSLGPMTLVYLVTVFIRLTALGPVLDLESGSLFEVGAYSRLGAY